MMTQKLTIRQFLLSDLERVYSIECASFNSPWAKADFKYHQAVCTEGFFVAAINNTIAGFIIIAPPMPKAGHILNLAVAPELRNLGVGTALVNYVIEKLRNQGVKRVWLEVRISNTGARTFYKKFGFREEGIIENYYTLEDAIVMVKEI